MVGMLFPKPKQAGKVLEAVRSRAAFVVNTAWGDGTHLLDLNKIQCDQVFAAVVEGVKINFLG